MRPFRCEAINDQRLGPCFSTNARTRSSSCVRLSNNPRHPRQNNPDENRTDTSNLCVRPYLFGPRTLDQLRIKNFLPSMVALHVCTIFEVLCNLLPILCTVDLDDFLQQLILWRTMRIARNPDIRRHAKTR